MERDSTQEHYEEMTQTPVPKLVLRLAVPTTISMLVTSIYIYGRTLCLSASLERVSADATDVVFALMAVINAFGFHVWTWCGQQYQPEIRGRMMWETCRSVCYQQFFLAF